MVRLVSDEPKQFEKYLKEHKNKSYEVVLTDKNEVVGFPKTSTRPFNILYLRASEEYAKSIEKLSDMLAIPTYKVKYIWWESEQISSNYRKNNENKNVQRY